MAIVKQHKKNFCSATEASGEKVDPKNNLPRYDISEKPV